MYFFEKNNSAYKLVSTNKNQLILDSSKYYLTALFFKLSSSSYSSILVDLFSYEINARPILVVLYTNTFKSINWTCFYKNQSALASISNIFLNSNWLERECFEMSNLFFSYKLDTRNLLLPYGDSSKPLKKSFPVIGYRELFYSSVSDSISSCPVTLQF